MPRCRASQCSRPYRPENAKPLDPEAFRFAYLQAIQAASTPHPLLHERVSPHLIMRDAQPGEPEALRLTDIPLNRVILTFRECFTDEREYFSAAWRYFALEELLEDPALDPWILVKGENALMLHDALLAVAATAPMNASGKFVLSSFLKALARWAEAHPKEHADELRKRRRL
jgi:hypothetical protein